MYLFIAIIFIAELIIAGFLLYWICKFDRSVRALDFEIAKHSPSVIDGIKAFRGGVNLIQVAITKVCELVQRKKEEFMRRAVNLVVIYIILFMLRTRFKKAATYCQYAVLLKDFWDSIPV